MKRTKKLMAVLLSLAMVMSLCTTALASGSGTTIGGEKGDGTGNSNTFFDTDDNHEGSVTSRGAMESHRPQDVIRLVLPTVTVDSDGVGDTFDMILDPHNLIQETVASGKTRIQDATFDTGTLVYFKTTDGDSTANPKVPAQYGADSKELKIINKSNVPVAVALTAGVERLAAGATNTDGIGDDYKFGTDTFKLVNSLTANNPTAPEMVLSLVKDNDTAGAKKIVTPTVMGIPTFGDATGSPIVKSAVFAFAPSLEDNYKKSVNNAIDALGLTLTPTKATGTKSADVLDKVVATLATGNVELDNAVTSVNAETWNATATTPAAEPITTGELSLTLTVKNKAALVDVTSDTGDTLAAKTVGTITVKLDAAAVHDELVKATPVAAVLTATKWSLAVDEKNSITTALDKLEGAYSTQYDQTGAAYGYVLGSGYTNDDFESVSFHLNAAINGGDLWDDLFTDNDDQLLSIKVTWDVTPFTGTENDLPAKGPSASVKSKVTNAGDTLEISYNLGRGNLASAGIDKVTYMNGTRLITLQGTDDTTNKVWSINAVAAVITAGQVKVTFKAASGQSPVEVDLTIK